MTTRPDDSGLVVENPVLRGGRIEVGDDYLQRLRCPTGLPVRVLERFASRRSDVSRCTTRRLAGVDPIELPLDVCALVCGCGEQQVQVAVKTYHRGPEMDWQDPDNVYRRTASS